MDDMGLEKQTDMESENPPEIKGVMFQQHHRPTPNHLFHHPEKNGRNVPMTDLWGLVYSSTWMAGFFDG